MKPYSRSHAKIRELAYRLIAHESAGNADLQVRSPSAFRVSEKLRCRLTTLAGASGFRSLISRALTLAKGECAELKNVVVRPDGPLEGFDAIGIQGAVEEPGVELIAQLLSLLATFIGVRLMLGIVVDEWTDFVPNYLEITETSDDEPTR